MLSFHIAQNIHDNRQTSAERRAVSCRMDIKGITFPLMSRIAGGSRLGGVVAYAVLQEFEGSGGDLADLGGQPRSTADTYWE